MEYNKPESSFPTRSTKLMHDFDIDATNLSHFYILPFKVCHEPKLKELQFKILNYILGTNLFLKKIKIKDCEKCDFCKKEKETIYHLFYWCEITNFFGNVLKSFGT